MSKKNMLLAQPWYICYIIITSRYSVLTRRTHVVIFVYWHLPQSISRRAHSPRVFGIIALDNLFAVVFKSYHSFLLVRVWVTLYNIVSCHIFVNVTSSFYTRRGVFRRDALLRLSKILLRVHNIILSRVLF